MTPPVPLAFNSNGLFERVVVMKLSLINSSSLLYSATVYEERTRLPVNVNVFDTVAFDKDVVPNTDRF